MILEHFIDISYQTGCSRLIDPGWDNVDNRFSLIKTKAKEREHAMYALFTGR